MGEKITYDYFYGGQLEAFSYYRLPRVLVTGQQFRGLSTDAKLLYALLLDRMGLSSRNGWYDDQGRVYIYYPVEEIEEDIGCGHGKAVRLLAELDSAKGIGLIERVRQGQGRPTKIFVKQFTTVEVPDFPCPPPPTGGEPMPTSTKMGCQEVPEADGQKYQNQKLFLAARARNRRNRPRLPPPQNPRSLRRHPGQLPAPRRSHPLSASKSQWKHPSCPATPRPP